MSVYKFTQHAFASPDAPQKPLVRKRAHSGGAQWVRVTRCPAKQAKKPRLGGSQQPACAHTEHHILSTTEAAAFAAQFWDQKTHPTKASQHEFLATCIAVNLEQDVKHAGRQKCTRKRGHQTTYFVPYLHCLCPVCSPVYSSVRKTVTTYPHPTHTFLKRPFLTDFEKYTHPPPPPQGNDIRPKVEKNLKKCEFAPCWQEMNVPERYANHS